MQCLHLHACITLHEVHLEEVLHAAAVAANVAVVLVKPIRRRRAGQDVVAVPLLLMRLHERGHHEPLFPLVATLMMQQHGVQAGAVAAPAVQRRRWGGKAQGRRRSGVARLAAAVKLVLLLLLLQAAEAAGRRRDGRRHR